MDKVTLKLLKKFYTCDSLPKAEVKKLCGNDYKECVEYLLKLKYIDHKVVNYRVESDYRCNMVYPEYSDYFITINGKAFIEESNRNNLVKSVAFIITSLIAIAGVVATALSIFF